ncbi:hypothetical protein [Nostoc sp.]
MLVFGAAASLTGGSAAFELHFQPPAGNESVGVARRRHRCTSEKRYHNN